MITSMLHKSPQVTRFLTLWVLASASLAVIGIVGVYAEGQTIVIGSYALKAVSFAAVVALAMTLMHRWTSAMNTSKLGPIKMGLSMGLIYGASLAGYHWLDFSGQGQLYFLNQIDNILVGTLVLGVLGTVIGALDRKKKSE